MHSTLFINCFYYTFTSATQSTVVKRLHRVIRINILCAISVIYKKTKLDRLSRSCITLFFKNFWRTSILFVGSLIFLFWTSDELCVSRPDVCCCCQFQELNPSFVLSSDETNYWLVCNGFHPVCVLWITINRFTSSEYTWQFSWPHAIDVLSMLQPSLFSRSTYLFYTY